MKVKDLKKALIKVDENLDVMAMDAEKGIGYIVKRAEKGDLSPQGDPDLGEEEFLLLCFYSQSED